MYTHTGGKDCDVKSWDATLAEVGQAIDISEDLDGDGKADCGAIDAAVTSVQVRMRVVDVCVCMCILFV